MGKQFSNIIVIFARLLRYVGFIGFIACPVVVFCLYRIIPDSFELPLGDLRNIVINADGNIYCGIPSYSRIQVYDPEGKFLYGKCISTPGSFSLIINSDGQLKVATATTKHIVYTFDKNGNLLFRRSDASIYTMGFGDQRNCYDEKSDISYAIKPRIVFLFGYDVVKINSSGEKMVFIRTPFIKWLFMGPFPAFFFIVLSVFLSLAFDQKFRKECSNQFQTRSNKIKVKD